MLELVVRREEEVMRVVGTGVVEVADAGGVEDREEGAEEMAEEVLSGAGDCVRGVGGSELSGVVPVDAPPKDDMRLMAGMFVLAVVAGFLSHVSKKSASDFPPSTFFSSNSFSPPSVVAIITLLPTPPDSLSSLSIRLASSSLYAIAALEEYLLTVSEEVDCPPGCLAKKSAREPLPEHFMRRS